MTNLDPIAIQDTIDAVIQSSSTASLLDGTSSNRIALALQPRIAAHDADLTSKVRQDTLRQTARTTLINTLRATLQCGLQEAADRADCALAIQYIERKD